MSWSRETAALLDILEVHGHVLLDTAAVPDLAGYLKTSRETRGVEPEIRDLLLRCREVLARGELVEARALAAAALTAAARLRPRSLLITAGTAGSGKSTVAGVLARQWGLVHLQTDVVRKRLAGLEPTARTGSAVYGGLYAPFMSDVTYREMGRLAAAALREGRSVVADGTFLTRSRRAEMVEVGRGRGVPVTILSCVLERAEQVRRLRERLAASDSVSEGGPEVMARHEVDWEPVLPSEADAVVEIDTRPEPRELEEEVLLLLWDAVLRSR